MSRLPLTYLDTPNPELWTYVDDGDAFVWTETGTTIAIAAHVGLVCSELVKHLGGLPSLTAILFVLDALSKGWSQEEAVSRIDRLTESVRREKGIRGRNAYSHLSDWLSSLATYSLDLRRGVRAHTAFLIETWEKLPPHWLEINREQAEIAIRWLNVAASDRAPNPQTATTVSSHRCNLATKALEYNSLVALNEATLRHRLETGLDHLRDLDSESPQELPDNPITQLLHRLVDNSPSDDSGWVARLAKEISTTIALPRTPSEPDTLQIGGVSDISNRGKPDRLLMSELALDSDLLIARIANGQALYLRRESPPKPRPQQRMVLMENGIRCWGEKRISITALALAVAAAEETSGKCQPQLFTVSGADCYPENFASHSGLGVALARLEPSQHPGEAIKTVLLDKYLATEDNAAPLLIVTDATATDHDFRAILQGLPKPLFLAQVESNRWISIFEHTSRGESLWKRFRLMPAQKPTSHYAEADDPLMLRQTLNGLRFLGDLKGPWFKIAADGQRKVVWALTANRRLLYFDRPGYGAFDLGSAPSTNVFAAHIDNEGTLHLLVSYMHHSDTSTPCLICVSPDGTFSSLPLKVTDSHHHNVRYAFDGDSLLRIGEKVSFINQQTGEVEAETKITEPHLGNAFFGNQELILLSCSNGQIQRHNLGKCPSKIGAAFRSQGTVPFAIAADLRWLKLFDGTGSEVHSTNIQFNAQRTVRLLHINSSATECLVESYGAMVNAASSGRPSVNDHFEFRIDTLTQTIHSSSSRPTNTSIDKFKLESLDLAIKTSVTTRLNFVGVMDDALLIARTYNNIQTLRLSPQIGRFVLSPTRTESLPERLVRFEEDTYRKGNRHVRQWQLRRALLGRCTVWLDTRGALHLRDCDGIELTLMLNSSGIAGWFSQGILFGPKYFTGHETDTAVPNSVRQWFARFLQQCSE